MRPSLRQVLCLAVVCVAAEFYLWDIYAQPAYLSPHGSAHDTREVTLLVTSGLAGRLTDDEHTVAELMATIDKLAAEAKNRGRSVALIDAGITLVPYAESRVDAGAAMLNAMQHAGFSVFAPNPVDLTVGPERLDHIAVDLPFPVLRGFDTRDPRLSGFADVARLELEPGIVFEVRSLFHPGFVEELRELGFEATALEAGTIDEPSAETAGAPETIRMLIMHSRGTGEGITSRRMTWDLLESGERADLIYDPDLGHDLVTRREAERRPVFLVGRQLHTSDPWQVAQVDIGLMRVDDRWRLDSVRQTVHGVDPSVEADPLLDARVRRAFADFREVYGRPLSEAAPTRREDLERFVLNAIREFAETEVAILNRGALRPVGARHFAQPLLQRETVIRLLSYDQLLVRGTLTGAQLVSLAEESSKRTDAEGSTRQGTLVFAGLKTEDGKTTINGRAVYDDDDYSVVTSSYLANGGDDYAILKVMDHTLMQRPEGAADASTTALANGAASALPVEAREDVVLPRLERADREFKKLERHGLWRFGVDALSLSTENVEVDADDDYDAVSDTRATANDSKELDIELDLFADQQWSALRWENRLSIETDISENDGVRSTDEDDLRVESRAVFTEERWLDANPYIGYILDTELESDDDETTQLEQSLIAGLLWTSDDWPYIRLAAVARQQDDFEKAERFGALFEASYLNKPATDAASVRPRFTAELLAESLSGDGDTIQRIDLELGLSFDLGWGLAVVPSYNFYLYDDSRLTGSARYEEFSLSLEYAWIGKWQSGLRFTSQK